MNPHAETEPHTVWSNREIDDGGVVAWRLGPLDLWLRRDENEWHVASRHVDEREDAEAVEERAAEPVDVEWRRWAVGADRSRVGVRPALPDRAVVARPAMPLTVMPNESALLFVSVPMWVRLWAIGDPDLLVAEIPATILTNSWFGTPVEGELCYGLRTRAIRSPEALGPRPYKAVCPLKVVNQSSQNLEVQRLCLRAEHLSLYRGRTHLWTDEVTIAYEGEKTLGRISCGDSHPGFDGASERLGEARKKPSQGLLARTFDNLKSIAGI